MRGPFACALQSAFLFAQETATLQHYRPSMLIFALQTRGLPPPQVAPCSGHSPGFSVLTRRPFCIVCLADQSPAGPTDGDAAASSARQQHPTPEAAQRQLTPEVLQQEEWFRPVTGRLLATAGAAAKFLSLNRPGSALHALAELAAERDPVAMEAASAAMWAGPENCGGEAHEQLPDGHWDELEACARPLPGGDGSCSGWEKLRLAEPGRGSAVTTVLRDLHR